MSIARAVTRSFAVSSLALVATAAGAADGVAYRVRDLHTHPYPEPVSRTESAELESAGSRAFFAGEDPVHGRELWVSDGTVAGTRIVVDLTTAVHGSDPSDLLRAGSTVYFVACTPATGCEPWRSDGTETGTRPLMDVRPGPASSDPKHIAVVQGRLYFSASDAEHGAELWSSDVATGETRLVEDIAPGPGSPFGSCTWDDDPHGLGLGLAGRLLFTAYDAVHGCELWRSDGTAAGTYLLKSLVPGPEGGYPSAYRRVGSRLFFVGGDEAHGRELWVTDGSAEGTHLVRDLVPGSTGSSPFAFGAIGDRLLFGAYTGPDGYSSDLWSTDGTSAGTQLVRSFSNPGAQEALGFKGAEVGGRVVFCAFDPVHGQEPWVTDGSPAGTAVLLDLVPGWPSSVSCIFGEGREGLYIGGQNESGRALWRTDGTPGGTSFVASLDPDPGERPDLSFAAAASGTMVQACDSEIYPHDCRLWRTDGSAAGTQRVFADLPLRSASHPRFFTAGADTLILEAFLDPERWALVSTDGSEAGTIELSAPADFELTSLVDRAVLANGEVIFSGQGDLGREPWRTDGAAVVPIVDLSPGSHSSYPHALSRVGDRVFFGAYTSGSTFWITDGSAAGTTGLSSVADPYEPMTEAYGRAWFASATDGSGVELWESSGTPSTTFEHDVAPGSASSDPTQITPLGATDALAFIGRSDSCERDTIYRFDLASGGASVVRILTPEGAAAYPAPPLAYHGGRLLFFDFSPEGICALWSSDGTQAGTIRVKHVGSGSAQSSYSAAPCPTQLLESGGALYFTACGPLAGCELWRSDGSTAGTNRVVDLVAGPGSSFPSHLTSIDGRLYFEACTSEHGCEPWVTDGSAAGLHRLADIAPGPASSFSAEFTLSQRLVYFASDDGTGSELWAMPLEIFYDGFATGDRSRWSSSTP